MSRWACPFTLALFMAASYILRSRSIRPAPTPVWRPLSYATSPFTTIGWRVAHVATCKVMYHEWAFGPRELTWLTIETPHDVEGGLEMLREGHEALREDLAALDDAGLETEVLTNWGEPWPAWKIFWTMIHHDLQHGGEVGALRDYLRTAGGA